MTVGDPAHAVARTWVEHLRTGGTTPWADWLAGPAAGDLVSDDGRPLPGAAQLELVRRFNLRYAASPGMLPHAAHAALVDRALSRSGPGRGLPQLPLLVPGSPPTSAVGAPPVDPARLPLDELIRLGVGLLADLVVAAGPLPDSPGPRRRVVALRPFHLAGAPVTTSGVRATLAAGGRIEGGWSPDVVLLAAPLDDHLAQVWTARVQHGAPVRWETFAGRWARRDALPPAADLPAIASYWAGRVGPSRVHVVVDDGDTDVAATVARVVGQRRAPTPVAGTDPAPLAPEATDLLRRLNRVLNVRAGDQVRPGLLRRAGTLLPPAPHRPLALPGAHRDWADRRAARVTAELRAGGYSVHGDPARIAPRHTGAAAPRRRDVLTLVLDTCLRTAELEMTGAGG